MRKIKKLVVTFLAICLMCPGLSVITEAATAELRFADPSTTVGAEVEVKTKLSSVSSLQSMEATLTYDKSELKFISGDNATAKDGTIKISWTGTGTTAEFNLKFQALKEGTSNIEVIQCNRNSNRWKYTGDYTGKFGSYNWCRRSVTNQR